ncbi:hypothetical protein J1N35_022337 [Gossypium stocksii]|uniref:Uncharacterized protein n=1 Tax=Gossypium stocksii TaxID=47602 RepID=A0A9D3VH04_9ROSI|nr:hypothetical protein J1N35_022337 [Gossypium stocksii]
MCRLELVPHGNGQWLRFGFLLGSASDRGFGCSGLASIVCVRKMTHLDRTKTAKVFASPTANERNRLESHKAMRIGNELSSLTVPHVVPPTTIAYISSVELESSGNQIYQAIHSNLAYEWKKNAHKG